MIKLGSGEPVRLIVAGLHGDEWETTSALVEDPGPPATGTLLIIEKVSGKAYMSTLDHDYYTSYAPHLLDAIILYKPSIYLELHSYSKENLRALTEKERFERSGVPPYVEIGSGILMGSVSPHIRLDHFTRDDLCLSFEVPKNPSGRSLKIIENLLDVVKDCSGRDAFVEYMKEHYPEQAEISIKNYLRFFSNTNSQTIL